MSRANNDNPGLNYRYNEQQRSNLDSSKSFRTILSFRPAVSVSATETCWSGTPGLYVFPTVASQMKISSSSTEDNASGTGCRLLNIEYLDSNYDEQNETIIPTGQTEILTVATDILRIQRITCLSSGSTGSCVGSVYIGIGTVTTGVPATIYDLITPLGTTSMTGIFTIPKGYRAYVEQMVSAVSVGKGVKASYSFRPFGGNTFIEGGSFNIITDILFNFTTLGSISERTDIMIKGKTTSGSASDLDFNFTISLYKL